MYETLREPSWVEMPTNTERTTSRVRISRVPRSRQRICVRHVCAYDVHDAARTGVDNKQLVVVDVVTAVEAAVNGRLVQLNLDLDDNRALVKAAAILTAEHP